MWTANDGLLKPRTSVLFVIFISLLMTSFKAKADEIQYLGESAEAYERLTAEVESAQSTIDMTYFIFNPSSSITRVLFNKVIAKAHNGVRVRLLFDANPVEDSVQMKVTEFFKGQGIQVKYYHPGSQYNPLNNVRTHAKIVVIDGKRYITGGRNIEDDYYGLSDWMNYIDREVWVKGPSARVAQKGFNKLWNSPYSEIRLGASAEDMAKFKKDWVKWEKKTMLLNTAMNKRMLSSVFPTPVVTCDNVQFTLDDENFVSASNGDFVEGQSSEYLSGDRLRLKETTDVIVKALFSANKNIFMENYSYLPTGTFNEALLRARQKKIPVLIITNRDVEKESYAQSTQNYYIGRDNYGTEKILQLSRHGAIRDEWDVKAKKTSFWTIHGKVFVIDEKTTIVSSFNIDPRSYHTNIENAVIAWNCPAFAQIVLKKGDKLINDYQKDKTCETCQKPTRDNGLLKSFLGWIGYNFI